MPFFTAFGPLKWHITQDRLHTSVTVIEPNANRSPRLARAVNAARVMGLQGYGLEAGCQADFVLLQARDPVEAIRLRATRLKVFKAGRLIAESPAATSDLKLPGRPAQTSWML